MRVGGTARKPVHQGCASTESYVFPLVVIGGKGVRIEHGQVPDFPRITAKILEDARAKVMVNGVEHPVSAEGISGTRVAVVAVMAETAKKPGRPVKHSSWTTHSVQLHRQEIMEEVDIRQIDKGDCPLFTIAIRPMLLERQPWYRSALSTRVGVAISEAERKVTLKVQERQRRFGHGKEKERTTAVPAEHGPSTVIAEKEPEL